MWELRDEVTNKVVFVGTEQECLEYSKKFPEKNFILVNEKTEKTEKHS